MYLKNGRFGPYIQYEIIEDLNEEIVQTINKKKKKKRKPKMMKSK